MTDLTASDSGSVTVLGMETSGKTASCAIIQGGVLLGETTFLTKLTHSQVILPVVKRTLSDSGLELGDIDLFAVASGPGSYTGLRIGIAAVKGICALGKPCIGVSTLEALAYNVAVAKGLILPVLAARKGVVYYGCYRSNGEMLIEVLNDRVADISELIDFVSTTDEDIILVGDCVQQLKDKYFFDNSCVRTAPPARRLQSASGVCSAAIAHISDAGGAGSLNARYLQNTMAEKLKKRK